MVGFRNNLRALVFLVVVHSALLVPLLPSESAQNVSSRPRITVHKTLDSQRRDVQKLFRDIRSSATGGVDHLPGPEFGFIPEYVGSALAGDAPLKWRAPCFAENQFSVELGTDTLRVEFGSAKRIGGFGCGDSYFITTLSLWHLIETRFASVHELNWADLDQTAVEDIQLNGVRLFRFRDNLASAVSDAFSTLLLFESALSRGPKVSAASAHRNLEFLRKYAGVEMPPRKAPAGALTPGFDPSLVQSGDLLGIVRLDGLDPLIMWATGSRLGHTAMALRIGGELYVCESQARSGYWPVDGVQKTPWDRWVALARRADYNVVWLPLSAASRAAFDAAAAAAAFAADFEGLGYGFGTFLFGWLDVPVGNLPPPLSWELLTTGMALADPALRQRAAGMPSLWNAALAHRLGLDPAGNATTRELLLEAARRRVGGAELLTAVERDAWAYPGPARRGPSMVCNVFVCRMWRAGGLLGGDFECGEMTPWDTYQLALFDAAPPPPACAAADPGLPYCQVLGGWQVRLQAWNVAAPFAHMRERCPATAPDYSDRLAHMDC